MIVNNVKRAANIAGKVLDKDDRELLGRGVVIAGGVAFALLTIAGSLGLAIRLFGIAAG